jgi:two-component system nitrate/nitrite response regulator NarL
MFTNLSKSGSIGVLTIDDHPVFRQGIRHMLQEEDGITPLEEASSVDSAIRWLRMHRADVVLLDHNLIGVNGVDAIPHLLEAQADLQIIMLTVCDDSQVFMQAIRFGACGYILKDTAPDRILEAITAAASGECRVSDSLVRTLFRGVGKTTINSLSDAQLHIDNVTLPRSSSRRVSVREKQILEQLVKGKSNKEIAKALEISPNTVRNQLQKLQDTFDARNRVQLALFAYDMGIGNA